MKCVVAKHNFTFLQLRTRTLKLFREFAPHVSIMFEGVHSPTLLFTYCAIPQDSGRVHLLVQFSESMENIGHVR